MKKKKRKLNLAHLLIVLMVPILILGGLTLTIKKITQPKEEIVVKTKKKEMTIEAFLQHAIEPVGSTLYVWGGGWNEEDTGAGKEAKTIGLSKKWKRFYQEEAEIYDYTQHAYEIHNGLDCSGFVGWVVYNTKESKNNQSGYVTESGNIPSLYQKKGFGSVRKASDVKNYKPGDIMANDEHVYIVLGQYKDGSVLLVHASPPGVRICGTTTASGNQNSQAIQAACQIMRTEYPKWYQKFPNCAVDASYLTDYDQFRWNTKTMKDAEKIQKLSAKQIVKLLWQ